MMKKTMLVAAMSVMASSLLAAAGQTQPIGFEGADVVYRYVQGDVLNFGNPAGQRVPGLVHQIRLI